VEPIWGELTLQYHVPSCSEIIWGNGHYTAGFGPMADFVASSTAGVRVLSDAPVTSMLHILHYFSFSRHQPKDQGCRKSLSKMTCSVSIGTLYLNPVHYFGLIAFRHSLEEPTTSRGADTGLSGSHN